MTFQPFTCFSSAVSSSPLSGSTPPRHGTHVLVARSDITTAILALGGAKAGDTDARCGQGVRSGSILLRICYPYVAAVCRISRTRSSTLRPISICAAGTNRRTPASIATGHRPMATRASMLNNALGRCISNLFPRSCHASLGPAYLSDGHPQYPYLLVQLRSCAKRAFGSFAGYLQLLLTATWRRICVEFRSRQRALRTTAATAGGGAGVSS